MKGKQRAGNRLNPWEWPRQRLEGGGIRRQGTAGVVLDPLTEVGVGMLVAVLVRRGQLMVHFQRDGKGRQSEEHTGQREWQCRAHTPPADVPGESGFHRS